MNGHPRDQAKVSVHCRWPPIRGTLTLKCVGTIHTKIIENYQVGLRNFYKLTIINWKMRRTPSKLTQVIHIFIIKINQIFFEFQYFFKYSVVSTDTRPGYCVLLPTIPVLKYHLILTVIQSNECTYFLVYFN